MNAEFKEPSDSVILSQLTAYLDGELNNDEIVSVEEKLANDRNYRKLMQKLQKTWDVLDLLPASKVQPSFTQSTMKLVVDDARNQAHQTRTSVWTWPIRILALLLIPAVASASSFFANRYFQTIPHQQLQQDLPVIKDFEVLTCDENLTIEFLEALAGKIYVFGMSSPDKLDPRMNMFQKQVNDLTMVTTLEDFEKGLLRNNRARFERLDHESQNELRDLHQQIESHPRSAALKDALFRYYFWLNEQTDSDAAQIRYVIDVDFKIDEIKRLVNVQFLPTFTSQLQPEDRKTIYLGLILLTFEKQAEIDEKFLELFSPVEEEYLKFETDLKFVDEQTDSETDVTLTPPYKTYFSGRKLKKIFELYPEAIDQIVSREIANKIKKGVISVPALEMLELASNLPDVEPVSEEQLLTRWLLIAFDDYFQTEPLDLEEFFKQLPKEEQEKLNNEFPEDRKRILQKRWKEQFGQSL